MAVNTIRQTNWGSEDVGYSALRFAPIVEWVGNTDCPADSGYGYLLPDGITQGGFRGLTLSDPMYISPYEDVGGVGHKGNFINNAWQQLMAVDTYNGKIYSPPKIGGLATLARYYKDNPTGLIVKATARIKCSNFYFHRKSDVFEGGANDTRCVQGVKYNAHFFNGISRQDVDLSPTDATLAVKAVYADRNQSDCMNHFGAGMGLATCRLSTGSLGKGLTSWIGNIDSNCKYRHTVKNPVLSLGGSCGSFNEDLGEHSGTDTDENGFFAKEIDRVNFDIDPGGHDQAYWLANPDLFFPYQTGVNAKCCFSGYNVRMVSPWKGILDGGGLSVASAAFGSGSTQYIDVDFTAAAMWICQNWNQYRDFGICFTSQWGANGTVPNAEALAFASPGGADVAGWHWAIDAYTDRFDVDLTEIIMQFDLPDDIVNDVVNEVWLMAQRD